MKIIIAGSLEANSGYEEKLLVSGLERGLKSRGHTVDSFFLPYNPKAKKLPDDIVAMKFIDLSMCDMLITVGYPACFLNHQNKKILLFKTYPPLFEYFDTDYGIKKDEETCREKEIVYNIEKKEFSANKVLCFSKTLSSDLLGRYGLKETYFPLDDLLESDSNNDYNLDSDFFVIETDLSDEDEIDRLLLEIKNNNIKIALFIPRYSYKKLKKVEEKVQEYEILDKVKIIKDYLDKISLKESAGYIYSGYEKRKISWGLIRALKSGVSIYSFDDSVKDEFLECQENIFIIENMKDINIKIDKDKENIMLERKSISDLIGNLV